MLGEGSKFNQNTPDKLPGILEIQLLIPLNGKSYLLQDYQYQLESKNE